MHAYAVTLKLLSAYGKHNCQMRRVESKTYSQRHLVAMSGTTEFIFPARFLAALARFTHPLARSERTLSNMES